MIGKVSTCLWSELTKRLHLLTKLSERFMFRDPIEIIAKLRPGVCNLRIVSFVAGVVRGTARNLAIALSRSFSA